MRALVFVIVLLLVGFVGLGFYRGWFQVSTDTTNPKPSATITVDKDKIRADEQTAKEKIGGGAGKVQEPERRP
jgi:hypothetical protein